METKQKSNVFAIAVMFMLFFMIAFVTNFAGSMGVIVQNQFGASNAMAQLGTLANFIAYACMGIPAGHILKLKSPPAMQETRDQSLGQEYSSIPA